MLALTVEENETASIGPMARRKTRWPTAWSCRIFSKRNCVGRLVLQNHCCVWWWGESASLILARKWFLCLSIGIGITWDLLHGMGWSSADLQFVPGPIVSNLNVLYHEFSEVENHYYMHTAQKVLENLRLLGPPLSKNR